MCPSCKKMQRNLVIQTRSNNSALVIGIVAAAIIISIFFAAVLTNLSSHEDGDLKKGVELYNQSTYTFAMKIWHMGLTQTTHVRVESISGHRVLITMVLTGGDATHIVQPGWVQFEVDTNKESAFDAVRSTGDGDLGSVPGGMNNWNAEIDGAGYISLKK